MSRQPLNDNDGEVRELTSEDFKHMRPASEVLPKELLSLLPKKGCPIENNPQKRLTIRLNGEIVDFFKSHGKDWQSEINDVLQKYVDSKC
ncbi:MAG: BrnA antitoxin family protein [Desulfamplus sp.]|nr:BrnA antitoxin family protein [Desulfamplus sp.]